MKPFTKRLALVTGLLFTAMLCLGVVYIDTTANYLRTQSSAIVLTVSNRVVMAVDLATGRIGMGDSNSLPQSSTSFSVFGYKPATNATGNGASANVTGRITMNAGNGGDTFATTTASGGTGGGFIFSGGVGGEALLATTNSTGGTGGTFVMGAGNGGGSSLGVATNATTGGNGGAASVTGGSGGSPQTASTNTVGGAGGSSSLVGGAGGTPSAGWARKTGNGGAVVITGGSSGNSVRTNSGDGGSVTITAGSSGNVGTAPGDPGIAGSMSLTAGNGGTGATNANGGSVFIAGGSSSAVSGNVLLAQTSGGTIRGAVGVRVPNPQQSLDVQGSTQISSNLINTNLTILAATNSTANTNITVNFDQAVTSLYLTNHASFTNVVNLAAGKSKSIIIFITAVGGPYNLVWPTLGGASFGTRLYTNANSPIWSSVTNKLAVSFTSDDTNAQISMTEWK